MFDIQRSKKILLSTHIHKTFSKHNLKHCNTIISLPVYPLTLENTAIGIPQLHDIRLSVFPRINIKSGGKSST